mmetsp:Transcript_24205/g.29352  ORF Transcript_24205/g.29352 Transcript_24205/m.29352 type:complete len:578 (-) Transcript_24205:244-1977(-)
MSDNKASTTAIAVGVAATAAAGAAAAMVYNSFFKSGSDIVHKSPFPDAIIPDNVSLQEFIFSSDGYKEAEEKGRIAYICGLTKKQITYGEFRNSVLSVAAGLTKQGVKHNDKLAVWSQNCIEYAILFHACGYIGAIITTMNPIYTESEVTHQIKDSGATMLMAHPSLVDIAKRAAAANGITQLFCFGDAEGFTPWSELINNDPKSAVPGKFDPKKQVQTLPYSSGTTGLPKGVMLSHYNIISNVEQHYQSKLIDPQPGDHFCGHLPMFHIYGMTTILSMYLCRGCTIVVIPKFEPELVLGILQDYKVNMVHCVPPLVNFFAKHPLVDKYNINIEEIISGAAPMGEELADLCKKRLGLKRMRNGFGMTEMAPTAMITRNECSKLDTVGPLFPNMTAKIVDPETGKSLGINERGEIWLAGPNVMLGYWNNEEATKNTMDKDGYVHTGDIGYIDDDGDYWIVDRLKELIKVNAFQVAPAELEAILQGHPKVADVAVMGIEAEWVGGRQGSGEWPKAYVVIKEGETLTEDDVKAYVKEQVAEYKQIRIVEFVASVPKSPSGKILRKDLKKMELERHNAKKA